MSTEYQKHPFLIILSAPSGGGKSTILKRILQECENIDYSISYTTRAPRGEEENGKHYFFVTEEEFTEKIHSGDFLEYANVFGNHYGTSRSYVESRLALGHHVIMDIDVQGALSIAKTSIDQVRIFILPPSEEELEHRLRARGTDSEAAIERRLHTVKQEIDCLNDYHYLVINDDLESATSQVKTIILAESLRFSRYNDVCAKFLERGTL